MNWLRKWFDFTPGFYVAMAIMAFVLLAMWATLLR